MSLTTLLRDWALAPIVSALEEIKSINTTIMTTNERILALVSDLIEKYFKALQDLADCKAALAEALDNDRADAEAIAAAEDAAAAAIAAKEEAEAALAPLLEYKAEDEAADATLIAALEGVLGIEPELEPEPEPPIE